MKKYNKATRKFVLRFSTKNIRISQIGLDQLCTLLYILERELENTVWRS